MRNNNEVQNEENPWFGRVEKILDSYNHCPICHAFLHFMHVTDFGTNLTHESSKCLECGLQTSSVLHKLQ